MALARSSGFNRKQRKELARRLQSDNPGLEVVHPHAAGIDVGNNAHYVAVLTTTSSRLTSNLRPDARLKIKYSPGTHSTSSLTRSLAASRSATTSSQRTPPPGCLLKISNGGTIGGRLVAKPVRTLSPSFGG